MDYKEKLRLAKEALESGSYDRETIEYIFPELAESKDERIRKELIAMVEEDWPGRTDVIDWLKSLKGREQPQPKQEWSEEDELHQLHAISLIEDIKDWANKDGMHSLCIERCIESIDWLKSLRPWSHWKPSDEQMEVLLSEVTAWTKGCPKQIVLESLYNDLKKLNTIEMKEVGLNYNKKTAILLSSHQEVARLFVNSLDYVYCMANNPRAEDLLKVIDITGKVYWCDEIEFIENE